MNIRQRFDGLIPGRKKSLATVVADRGDGTATVTSAAGSDYVVMTAGATIAAGDKVVVRDGQIIAKAPDLPVFSVTV